MSDDGSLKQTLGDLVLHFCDVARVEGVELEGALPVRALALELPVELAVERDASGALAVLASPPSQRVATSVLPVFHRMAVRIEREEV